MANPWDKYTNTGQAGPGVDPRIANEVAASQYDPALARATLQVKQQQAATAAATAGINAQKNQREQAKFERAQTVPALTPAQTKVDAEFAKEYTDFRARGGSADVQKNLSQLKDALEILKTSDTITGPVIGRMPDIVKQAINSESINTREGVEEVVQRNLRLILGAQFTEKEGERLISRAFNPNLQEKDNIVRLERLIGQISGAAKAKGEASDYYEQNGTLAGWVPSKPEDSVVETVSTPGDNTVGRTAGGADATRQRVYAPGEGQTAFEGGAFSTPEDKDIGAKLQSAFDSGAGINDLNAIAGEGRMYRPGTEAFTTLVAAMKYRDEGGQGAVVSAPQSGFKEQSILGRAADTSPGAYAVGAANALTAGYLDELGPEGTQEAKEYLRGQYPVSTFAGDVSGGAAAMLPIGRGVQAGARAAGATALGNNALRAGLIGDVAYGSALGSGESNENRLLGAGIGAGAAGIGNVAGSKIANALGRGLRGVSDPAVNRLNAAGVPLTMGQIVGQGGRTGAVVKGIEDRVSGLPIVGDIVNARRREGIEAFNQAAFDDALAPIGAQSGGIGEVGIGNTQRAISDSYDDALSGVNLQRDEQLINDLAGRFDEAASIPGLGEQTGFSLERSVSPFIDETGNITGKNFQNVQRDLARRASAFGKGQEAVGPDAAAILKGAGADFNEFAARQAPEVVPALGRSNEAYKRASILEDVVGQSAKNTDGIFTPAQLGAKAVQNTNKFGGKKASARGDRPFFELQRDAQNVLPSKIPDTGTAGRIAVPAAIGAGAYGGQESGLLSPEVAGLVALLAAPQTKIGQKAVQKALLNRSPGLRNAGEELLRNNRLGGIFGAGAGTSLGTR